MCLSSPFLGVEENAESAMTKVAHDGVGCDNVQAFLLKTFAHAIVGLYRLPVQLKENAEDTRMIMYPVAAQHTEYNVPSVGFDCLSGLLEAWMNPEDFVPMSYVQTSGPKYRSLADGNNGATEGAEISIPEKPCVVNADGSRQFFIMLSQMEPPLLTPEDMDSKHMWSIETILAYKLKVTKVIVATLVKQLRDQGIDGSYLFPMSEENPEEVSPEAYTAFLEQLYPSMMVNTDIFVCIPPLKETESGVVPDWGNGGQAAFNLAFYFPPEDIKAKGIQHFPLLGASHNLDPGNVGKNNKAPVEDNFYVVTNVNINSPAQVLPANAVFHDNGVMEDARASQVKLYTAKEYRDNSVPKGYEWLLPHIYGTEMDKLPEQHYDDPIPERHQDQTEMTYGADLNMYRYGAKRFQLRVSDQILGKLDGILADMHKHSNHTKTYGPVHRAPDLKDVAETRGTGFNGYHYTGLEEPLYPDAAALSITNIKGQVLDPTAVSIMIPDLLTTDAMNSPPYKRPKA